MTRVRHNEPKKTLGQEQLKTVKKNISCIPRSKNVAGKPDETRESTYTNCTAGHLHKLQKSEKNISGSLTQTALVFDRRPRIGSR